MPTPTLTVEVSFVSSPLTASPTWVDVTQYVRHSPGIRISRGRPSESSTFSAGQLSLTLNNRDRRFDPLHSAGPYFGNLTPRKQIRVRATHSATTYDLFRGFVTGWPTQYPQVGRDAVTEIVAYDALALLNETTMPDQVYRYADTTIGSLWGFFRQTTDAGWVDAKGGKTLSVSTGLAQFGSTNLAPALTNSRPVVFNGSTGWGMPSTQVAASNTFSVSFWMQTTSAGPSLSDWMAILATQGTQSLIGIDSAGYVRFYGGSFFEVSSSIIVNDGQSHHVVISSSSTTIKCYVDGVDRTSAAAAASWPYSLSLVGAPSSATSDTYFTGTLQDIALFTKELSAGEVETLYATGTGVVRQTTSTRATFTLDSVGWPASLRSTPSLPAGICGTLLTTNKSALNEMQLLAATEQGRMFVGKEGNVTLHDRFWSSSQARGNTIQATFSDDGADIGYQSFGGFDPGDRDVVNDATVTGAAGAQRSQDATSITNVGQRSVSVETEVPDLGGAKAIADGIVYLRATARSRAQPLEVSLTDTATFAALLGLEIGDRYRVEVTPLAVGSQIQQQLHVESIDWDIDQADWRLRIGGTPAPTTTWAIVGTSTVGSTDVVGY